MGRSWGLRDAKWRGSRPLRGEVVRRASPALGARDSTKEWLAWLTAK
jgi:hypothetical protein